MTGTPVTENLIQITRFGAVNCFLLREEDGSFTVIDTALPGSHSALLIAAKERGGSIRRILLTHAHFDHTGSLQALRRSLPKAEILVSAREERLLRGDFSLDRDEPPSSVKAMFFTPMPEIAVATFQWGDAIGALEAVAAPGHTPGHTAFIDRRDGTLIAGDALQTKGGVAVSGVLRPAFPLPALATWNTPVALDSARALRARSPSRVAVGHGDALEPPLTAFDKAITDAGSRLAQGG